MIVYVEGLSSAGKTTFIESIKNQNGNVVSIPEFPKELKVYSEITTEFCRMNDEKKCQEAVKLDSKNTIVLIDRAYASTLAYGFIQYSLGKGNEYLKSLEWYFSTITSGNLVKPSLYVYLAIDKETSILRARQDGRFTTRFAWFLSPEYAIDFYSTFFRYFEPEIPLLTIDSKMATDKQCEDFWKGIEKISNINK